MKIQTILEAQFSPAIYAYHATSGTNLQSILKHGLIPNKQAHGYGSDERSHDFGYTLAALPGTYFTLAAADAEHIAKTISNSPIIIICKIQKRDASLDEDRMTGKIIDESKLLRRIRMEEHKLKAKYSRLDDVKLKQKMMEHIPAFSEEITNDIIKDKLSNQDSRMIANIKPDLLNYISMLVGDQLVDNDGPDWQEKEAKLKQAQDVLTKKLKNLLYNDDSNTHSTLKIDKPITYSGANKIVGFYNFIAAVGWGDLGDFERDAYHKVKNPMELLKN
jgi:hypothetical protein